MSPRAAWRFESLGFREVYDYEPGKADWLAAGWDVCVVVNDQRVVLGLLTDRQLDGGGDRRVEEVMRPGPSTFRPNVGIIEMAAYMVTHDLASAPVTTSDGRLVGVLFREDAVRVAHELHSADGRIRTRTPEEDAHGER